MWDSEIFTGFVLNRVLRGFAISFTVQSYLIVLKNSEATSRTIPRQPAGLLRWLNNAILAENPLCLAPRSPLEAFTNAVFTRHFDTNPKQQHSRQIIYVYFFGLNNTSSVNSFKQCVSFRCFQGFSASLWSFRYHSDVFDVTKNTIIINIDCRKC